MLKDIPDYEGYMASEEGHIYNKHKAVWLKETPNKYGYPRVSIGKKMVFVHKLVALAFKDNPEGKPTVNHINEIKTDNRACNLEWATYRENNIHGTRMDRVSAIKRIKSRIKQYDLLGNLIHVYRTKAEAARSVSCNEKSIRDCLSGKTHSCKGYRWEIEVLSDVSLSLF